MRILFFLVFLCAFSFTGNAQTVHTSADTDYCVQLKAVKVVARWKNDTERYHYNQMRYYVTTILPYLNAATKLFEALDMEKRNTDISKRERRQFIEAKEDEMRNKFETEIKQLNVTQGVLLVKLIARQTDLNIYKALREFKNPFIALKWQAWARVNGMNLDRMYHPEEEHDLELIMEDLGYPLPASYAANNY